MAPLERKAIIDSVANRPTKSNEAKASKLNGVSGFRGRFASFFSFGRSRNSDVSSVDVAEVEEGPLLVEQFAQRYFEHNLLLTSSEYQKHLQIVLRICQDDEIVRPDQIPFGYFNRIFSVGSDGQDLMLRVVNRFIKGLQLKKYISKQGHKRIAEAAVKYVNKNTHSNIVLSSFISEHDAFRDAEKSRDDAMEERIHKMTLAERKKASKAMLRLIPGNLRPGSNPLALTDKELQSHFYAKPTVMERKNYYLSTYFRSAFLGLTNRSLESFVARAQEIRSFIEMARHYKQLILEVLTGQARPDSYTESYDAEVPVPANVLFTKNGTEAGKLLFRNCIDRGEKVLVTTHEFDKFTEDLESNGSEVVRADDLSEKALREQLKDQDIHFILVSDISRLGASFPLEMFSRLRDEFRAQGRELYLIVDACQTVGRKPLDYRYVDPDAVIASAQKGSEIHTETGFLVVKDELMRRSIVLGRDLKADGNDVQKGTILGDKIVSAAVALKPDSLQSLTSIESSLPNGVKDKLFAPIEKRHQALLRLSEYFVHVMEALYRSCHSGSIDILNPSKLRDYEMRIDHNQLSGIFELRLNKCSIETLVKHASYYGVSLDIIDDGSLDEPTVRIALHPYMNFEAIRVLGYVFLQVLGEESNKSK